MILKRKTIKKRKNIYNRKYIAKITNSITKQQFLTIIKLTYTGIK